MICLGLKIVVGSGLDWGHSGAIFAKSHVELSAQRSGRFAGASVVEFRDEFVAFEEILFDWSVVRSIIVILLSCSLVPLGDSFQFSFTSIAPLSLTMNRFINKITLFRTQRSTSAMNILILNGRNRINRFSQHRILEQLPQLNILWISIIQLTVIIFIFCQGGEVWTKCYAWKQVNFFCYLFVRARVVRIC